MNLQHVILHDGTLSHAVTVVDSVIFDSTQKRALRLQKTSLDWICGSKDGCAGLDVVAQFKDPYKMSEAKAAGCD